MRVIDKAVADFVGSVIYCKETMVLDELLSPIKTGKKLSLLFSYIASFGCREYSHAFISHCRPTSRPLHALIPSVPMDTFAA